LDFNDCIERLYKKIFQFNEAPCGKPQDISMEQIVSLVTATTTRKCHCEERSDEAIWHAVAFRTRWGISNRLLHGVYTERSKCVRNDKRNPV